MKKIIFVLFAVLLAGCAAQITKKQAEDTAVVFISKNVRFFSKYHNETVNVNKINVSGVESYQEDKNWVVVMHVASNVINESKKNDLTVRINSQGEITEFNGKKVGK